MEEIETKIENEKKGCGGDGLLYFLVVLLGTGALLIYNAIITPVNFWSYTMPDYNVLFYISFSYNAPQLIVLFIMMKWGEKWNLNKRVWITLLILIAGVVVIPLIPTTINNQTDALVLVIITTMVLGIANGILSGSIFSLSASLGGDFSVAAMIGNGIAGILMELIRIITQAAMNSDDQIIAGTIIYFVLAGVVLICCLVGFEVIRCIPKAHRTIVMMHGKIRGGQNSNDYIPFDESVGEEQNISPPVQETTAGLITEEVGDIIGQVMPEDVESKGSKDVLGDDEDIIGAGNEEPRSNGEILKSIWVDCLSIFFVFFITLALFPGVTNMVTPASSMDPDWFGIWNMSCFMVGDMVGRSLPQLVVLWGRKTNIVVVFARLIFYPLIILQVEEVLHSDLLLYITMLLFSATNGYTSTLAMMYGPTQVEKKDKPQAGVLMTVFLNSGLFGGSLLALGLNPLLS
ncbi:Equilibrative nucleoside transporter like protein [Aduncisulcus paluster]|uniref:Equilibrative nucleoside transporter like protein n=1 Tax=Aduncisulcus paluster TaxID=2918883 RepID=A0ABQ5KU47_9EUKA|nr:Equilibrative nucleoside transporter like protein [Aduncisulcus paluster]